MCAADGGLAAHMGAGEAERFAQKMNEKEAGLNLVSLGNAVNGEGDGSGHFCVPGAAIFKKWATKQSIQRSGRKG